MTVKRTTQVAVESLSQVDPKARASQIAVESLSQVDPKARITQMCVEVLSSNSVAGAQQPVMFILT